MTASLPGPRASRAHRLVGVPTALAAALVAVLGSLAVAAWRAPVLVHQCVAGDGLAGSLGLRLALLRADATCPTGVAVGADGAQAAGVVVMVAAPVLLLHVTLAGTGAGLMALAAALVRALGRVLGRIAPVVPARVRLPLLARAPRAAAHESPVLASWLLPTVGLRGPPALAA